MKPKPIALPTDVSLQEVCWLLGVTKQRIDQLAAAGVVEKVARGRYSITSVPRFVETQRKGGTGPQTWQDVRTALAQEKSSPLAAGHLATSAPERLDFRAMRPSKASFGCA